MAQPSPLRIAIIGLSASAVTNWAAEAHLPGLLSEEGRKLFQITALCNSSVEAAQKSIKHFNLPSSTKAYGDPQSLANDPDIDIVICNTRVDKHYETLMPSIKAGKAVWVEWPVAANMEEVNDMYRAAQESGSRVAVGLQGRYCPPVRKMNEIIVEGKVGKVLSSEVHIYGGAGVSRDDFAPGFEYFAERKVGGNHVTVLFGHMIDHVQNVLGSFVKGSSHAMEQVQWPIVKTTSGAEEPGTVHSDAPDLFYVIGKLTESSHVTKGASSLATYHRAWPLLEEPSQTWTITCENAIARLRAYSYPSLQADAYDKPVTIDIHWYADGQVESIAWKWEDETVPIRARNTKSSFFAFAKGEDSGYADLKSAADVSDQLHAWLSRSSW